MRTPVVRSCSPTIPWPRAGRWRSIRGAWPSWRNYRRAAFWALNPRPTTLAWTAPDPDRKSTRLNSSHLGISYAVFFFNDTATTEIYTLSLHDALPIWPSWRNYRRAAFWALNPRPTTLAWTAPD